MFANYYGILVLENNIPPHLASYRISDDKSPLLK